MRQAIHTLHALNYAKQFQWSPSRFDRYLTEVERLQFLAAFIRDATFAEVTEVVIDCRDLKDNKFLELALSNDATCIISGDDDLLILHPFRNIAIVTPQEFVRQWR